MLPEGEKQLSTLMDAVALPPRPLGAGITGAWQLRGDPEGNYASVSRSRNLRGFHQTSPKAKPNKSVSRGMATAQNPMHVVAQHNAQLSCLLQPPGILCPSTGSQRGRAMGTGRSASGGHVGRGFRHIEPDRAALDLAAPGGPAAPLHGLQTNPVSSASEQRNAGGAQFTSAEEHPPRSAQEGHWGLSGAGVGHVP